MLGSTQQVARILFEVLRLRRAARARPGYSTDARARSIRGEHEIVGVLEEWRELSKLVNTYLGPLPQLISERDGRLHTTFNQAAASTGRLSTTNPNLQAIPIRTELGREIRSAFVAEQGCAADLGRLQPGRAADPRPRLWRPRARRSPATRTSTRRRRPRCSARTSRADEGRAQRRQDGQLRDHLRILAGLSENLGDPARAGAGVHRHLSRALPRAGLHPAHDRAGRAGRLCDDAARPPPPVPEIRVRNRQTRARRAPGRQLGHAGHRRRRDQGGDDPDPRPSARGGRGARLVLQVHDELLLEAPETETSAIKELVRRRCAAPTRSTCRWRSTSATATTGTGARASS